MKFAKVLEKVASELPAEHLFLRYKQLKKMLKAIPAAPARTSDAGAPASNAAAEETCSSASTDNATAMMSALYPEELKFVATLNEDLAQFNQFFMEKEEEAVIQMQALSDELQAVTDSSQLQQLKARLVEFHGSCILLMHWSLLNYAAVAKILKKHDKRTGVLLRAPYLANVLQQPFNSTSVMSKLVKNAEALLQRTMGGGFPAEAAPAPEAGEQQLLPQGAGEGQEQEQAQLQQAVHYQHHPFHGVAGLQGMGHTSGADSHGVEESSDEECSSLTATMEELQEPTVVRCTKLALETWENLCRNASTPSTFAVDQLHMQQHQHPAAAAAQAPVRAAGHCATCACVLPASAGASCSASGKRALDEQHMEGARAAGSGEPVGVAPVAAADSEALSPKKPRVAASVQ